MTEHVHAISVEEWMMSNDQSSSENSLAAHELLLSNCNQRRCFEFLMKAEFGVDGKSFVFAPQYCWATLVPGRGAFRLQVETDGHAEYDETFDVPTDGNNQPIEGQHIVPTPSGSVKLVAIFTFYPLEGDATVVVEERKLAHPWPESE